MFSVISFLYQKKEYLGVSGDRRFFEVFDLSKLKAEEFLSKLFSFLFGHLFDFIIIFFVNIIASQKKHLVLEMFTFL